MARIVSYKFRETDQTVYISGSGGTSASIAADVAAIKLPAVVGIYFTTAGLTTTTAMGLSSSSHDSSFCRSYF